MTTTNTETRRDVLEAMLDALCIARANIPGLIDTDDDIRRAWIARFEDAEPTGIDLVEHLTRASMSHRASRICPGCDADLAVVGLTQLAYTFGTCSCGTPEYDHLTEQLWHLRCAQTSPKAAEAVAVDLLEAARWALPRPSRVERRNIANRIGSFLDARKAVS